MKSITLFLLLAMILSTLTGCAQETLTAIEETKNKVTYATGVLSEAAPLATAYVGLNNLYLNPLSYTDGNWKTEFDKHDDTIEGSYERLKTLQPTQEFSEMHELLLSTLDQTIKINDVTEKTIEVGGKMTGDITKQFETSYESFRNISSRLEELKNIKE
ncbi:hypothetical protein ACFVS2_20120 [Brevibacillus sp. NPDC058079]|uniref:hypothetical protein n=1 Tax=Brevibacillus sp. NPDC058079 TaxID=3346330 RepID=UPI0036F0275F